MIKLLTAVCFVHLLSDINICLVQPENSIYSLLYEHLEIVDSNNSAIDKDLD